MPPPLPSEMLAAQPKYIAILCRLCGTLMHATESQIGQELTCPDCAKRTLVAPPASPKPAYDVLEAHPDDYQLDEAFAPTERPAAIQVEYKGMLYEQERDTELAREAAIAAKGGKQRLPGRYPRPCCIASLAATHWLSLVFLCPRIAAALVGDVGGVVIVRTHARRRSHRFPVIG